MDNYISPTLIAHLRSEAAEAEKIGRLTNNQLATIYREKWFNIFVPKTYGGLALDLLEGLKLEECLAWIDGSLGWTVTLCAGANLFVGYLDPKLAQALFKAGDVCLGGSGKTSGIAKVIPGGFLLNGEWSYATGAPHNTAFTANCVIAENGTMKRDAYGEPIIKSFLFLRDEVSVLNDWDAMGLKATASHTFKVNDLILTGDRSFVIDNRFPLIDETIYQYPFLQFAETTLAVNVLGMAKRFLALCAEQFAEIKEQGRLPETTRYLLDEAWIKTNAISALFYESVGRSWADFRGGNRTETLLQEVSSVSKRMVKTLQSQVCLLYPHCGMLAAKQTTEINRVWRNIFTASQHNLLI